MPPAPHHRVARAMRAFLALEASGGIILASMMVVALVWVNSPWGGWYDRIFSLHAVVGLGPFKLDKSLLHWINDGLMAIFFLVVALEIKREMLEGELSSPRQVLLPTFAALGGMMIPSLIFVGINLTGSSDTSTLRGWAIPSATDIAFSLGVLSVLGRRVPLSLRLFLTALAIIDDLGAIVIIAIFYTSTLSWGFLGGAVLALLGLLTLNRLGVARTLPYVLFGLVLWVCLLESGIHATIGGVVLGLCIPLRGTGEGGNTLLRRLEKALHPWVAYAILPIFALANSGIPFSGLGADVFRHPIFLGVALGLFLGKQVGVFLFSWVLIQCGWVQLPSGAGWRQLYGVCILTGIGFTMSLFIGGLAFPPDGVAVVETRFGVLMGSLMSALVGYLVLMRRPPEAETK